ncbi:Delta(12) fatty acid desaturase [Grifola frondosa]|uniref:Delta(12) fatty acid desaturase n=1 Tax=Grifola frondosa TaxID=5627 RepID=A0A1C7LQS1_GRIFR|nr:Delta(12) fatty acid desaturase [Grifola frondosa]
MPPSTSLTDKPCTEERIPEFYPMSRDVKMSNIRATIPSHLFVRNTATGLSYVARDVGMAGAAIAIALCMDSLLKSETIVELLHPAAAWTARWTFWMVYWWFQGLILPASGSSDMSKMICDVVGFIMHTATLAPYYSWKITHHHHHMYHGLMERDESWIPMTRSELKIPSEGHIEYSDYLDDTPIYALFRLVRRQLLGIPAYFLVNVSGRSGLPGWTSHLNPLSVMFTVGQRKLIIMSDIGIMAMLLLLYWSCSIWGGVGIAKYYAVPWLLMNHWLAAITYLHHTDPALPHYRRPEWTFPRGAVATLDRDFLGWMGRFFFHDISHFHVIHHFFPKMPFYHAAEATQYLKRALGDHYHHSDKPVLKALWDNYFDCQFVEDTGDIIFYRDVKGRAVIKPAEQYNPSVLIYAASTCYVFMSEELLVIYSRPTCTINAMIIFAPIFQQLQHLRQSIGVHEALGERGHLTGDLSVPQRLINVTSLAMI